MHLVIKNFTRFRRNYDNDVIALKIKLQIISNKVKRALLFCRRQNFCLDTKVGKTFKVKCATILVQISK